MPEYVALMRAVNVAGHARVSMSDVQKVFAVSGCENVQTIIQSGNILFEAPARTCAQTLQKVRRQLRAALGEEPQIVLRTVRQIADLVKGDPFAAYQPTARMKFYVAFLTETPRRLPAFPLLSSREALEAIGISGQHVFIVSGLKKSGFFGFPNNFIEAQLGVAATTRNWSTVTKIVQFAGRQTAGRRIVK